MLLLCTFLSTMVLELVLEFPVAAAAAAAGETAAAAAAAAPRECE